MPLQSVNYKAKLFNIPCGKGFTCLGFDVCMDRTLRLVHELGKEAAPVTIEYGTPRAYAEYERLCSICERLNQETGWRSKTELTPQLIGLEGRRVEVVDCYGETRRFYVGKSSGHIPCHLEIHNRRCHGGPAVMGTPFKSVTRLSRVWYRGKYVFRPTPYQPTH